MLNKIKNIRKDSGFTIVELLIVIVVIGILAAITIVSYTGITQKANATKAQTNAVAVQKVAEAFHADKGYYPGYVDDFTSGAIATLPAGVTVAHPTATPLSAVNGKTNVGYVPHGTAAAATGAVITWWDFSKPSGSEIQTITLGTTGTAVATLGATRP